MIRVCDVGEYTLPIDLKFNFSYIIIRILIIIIHDAATVPINDGQPPTCRLAHTHTHTNNMTEYWILKIHLMRHARVWARALVRLHQINWVEPFAMWSTQNYLIAVLFFRPSHDVPFFFSPYFCAMVACVCVDIISVASALEEDTRKSFIYFFVGGQILLVQLNVCVHDGRCQMRDDEHRNVIGVE